MIQAEEFVEPALKLGYSFWAGVPCSFLTPFINYVIQSRNLTYVGAASEGEAVGIAAGAYLAGRKTVVICQNSGLGNTVNPLTSLNFPFRIPTMLITTHRGAPGLKDEPQHEQMGQITDRLLEVMDIPCEAFPSDAAAIAPSLARAEASMAERSRPFAFLMAKGSVDKYKLQPQPPRAWPNHTRIEGSFSDSRLPRYEAIGVVWNCADPARDAIVATTGKIGRELFTAGHRPNQIYVVGSMGCASAIGLGIHQASARKNVIVLDGDGAALMKLGSFGTIGHYQPERLLHIVLDNEAHESTGAQATSSSTIDFCSIAAGCGYRNAWRASTRADLTAAVAKGRELPGPNLIHAKVSIATAAELGRPTVSPAAVKEQFMAWMAQ